MSLRPCTECKREISTEAKVCPNCGKKNPTARPNSTALGCAGLLAFVFLIGLCSKDQRSVGSSSGTADVANSSTPAPTESPKQEALRQVEIVKWSWSKGGFDNIMMATFRVKNGYSRPVKDLEFTCVHSAPSGTVIDQNVRTVYEVIGAGKTRKLPETNMGFMHSQAASSTCTITDLVVE
jgi:hypothetical protein